MFTDPEALIVKGGVLALAMLSVVRLVLHDLNHLVNDFRRRKRRRIATRSGNHAR
jgi:hypothetical protein